LCTGRVTVDDDKWEIGSVFPTFSVSYAGFADGQDETALGGQLAFTTEAGLNSTVGKYAVFASGLVSDDFVFVYVPGMLGVTPKQVEIDIHQGSLNIASNGAISLVILGTSSFDVSQISLLAGFAFAGVELTSFNQTFVDANGDGSLDLMLHFHMNDELRAALEQIYADLLQEDYADDGNYSHKQLATLSLEGEFGEYDQQFEGSDSLDLLFSGKALRELLETLDL
jgi:hypothetical protein